MAKRPPKKPKPPKPQKIRKFHFGDRRQNVPELVLFHDIMSDFMVAQKLYHMDESLQNFYLRELVSNKRECSIVARDDTPEFAILNFPVSVYQETISGPNVDTELVKKRSGRALFFNQNTGRSFTYSLSDAVSAATFMYHLKKRAETEEVSKDRLDWAEGFVASRIVTLIVRASYLADKYMPLLSESAQKMATYSMGLLRGYSGEIPENMMDFLDDTIPIDLEKVKIDPQATFMDYYVAMRAFANLVISDAVEHKVRMDDFYSTYSTHKIVAHVRYQRGDTD